MFESLDADRQNAYDGERSRERFTKATHAMPGLLPLSLQIAPDVLHFGVPSANSQDFWSECHNVQALFSPCEHPVSDSAFVNCCNASVVDRRGLIDFDPEFRQDEMELGFVGHIICRPWL